MREGLRMSRFLNGIESLAAKLAKVPVLSNDLLDLIRHEMQVQFKTEQRVSAILPVHNIGALSLDTISLKNVLKAESRAWKMLYGHMLLAHAHGLLNGLLTKVDHISRVMQRTKKSETGVHQMIELVNALSGVYARRAQLTALLYSKESY
jgi:hypothetical protein